MFTLKDFVRESNRIEGINREPTAVEIKAHEKLLSFPALTVSAVREFVQAVQPDAVLRDQLGLDVYVGNHTPPAGSPGIEIELDKILDRAANGEYPWTVHIDYETLHPFTDGNGRSGRAIWLWQNEGRAPLGFLHAFYYQTLSTVSQ